MSTELSTAARVESVAVGEAAGFAFDGAWALHEQVSIRPERFGALLYHFGTRRLSFLKSPVLLSIVTALADSPSARAACVGAGVPDTEFAQYRAALATLAASHMIRPRSAA